MAEPKKLTQKEYDAIRSDYEKRYGYDSRSDEEKDVFDKKFDEHYQVEKKDASGDATEGTEKGPKKLNEKEYDAIRSDYEKRYGYDSRSPEEKAAFDKKFDEHYQVDKKSDTEDDDTNEQNEEIENDRERERGGRGFREIDDDER